MMVLLYDDVYNLTKAFFGSVDCGTCNNHHRNVGACKYCSNDSQHNLLWNVSDVLAHNFVEEIVKLVKEDETVD